MIVQPLKWDSAFFRLKIGKAILPAANNLTFPADFHRYDLIYLEQTGKRRIRAERAQLLNISYVDKKTIYSKKLSGPVPILNKNIHEYTPKSANKALKELAIESGHLSRFKLDPNFAPDACDRLYVRWMENSVKKSCADYVLIYGDQQHPVAFISLIRKEDVFQVGLLSVSSNHQQKGIGKQLIEAAEHFALKNKMTTLQVITQTNNKNACQFYEKCGFKKEAIIYTYHIWNK